MLRASKDGATIHLTMYPPTASLRGLSSAVDTRLPAAVPPPFCGYRRSSLGAVIASVSRQSAISRLTDFFNKSDQLIRMMDYQVQAGGPLKPSPGYSEVKRGRVFKSRGLGSFVSSFVINTRNLIVLIA